MASAADQAIDELLERYLGLVDQYASLRAELAALQQGVFQNLARANFTSDRGARYGPDQYDERMQALRRLVITKAADAADDLAPTFAVAGESVPSGSAEESGAQVGEEGEEKEEAKAEEQPAAAVAAAAAARNPIRWFGVLVPQALRDAQSQSVRVVEEVIPRLASIEAEMALLEIEVRRARKKRAKAAAAAAGSTKQETTNTPQPVSASS